MRKVFLIIAVMSIVLKAEDVYELTYRDDNCTLLKNGESIALFDKRFKKKKPKTSYSCSAIQKEQYRSCEIEKKKNISALVFSYGQYEYTNLLISFKAPTKYVDAFLQVRCTKKIKK